MNSQFNFTFDLTPNVRKVNKKKSKTVKEYYELAVYKASIDLIKQLTNSTQQAPATVKTGLLKDAQQKIIDMIRLIQLAANDENREDNLFKALEIARNVLITIRVFFELGYLKTNGFSLCSSNGENVVRQLHG